MCERERERKGFDSVGGVTTLLSPPSTTRAPMCWLVELPVVVVMVVVLLAVSIIGNL